MLKPSLAALAAALGLAAFTSMPAIADDSSSASAPSAGASGAAQATTTTGGVSVSLTIPTITTVDSSMDENAIRDALTGNFAAHVKELQTLNATSIKIPEVDFTVVVTGDTPSTTKAVYKDIELDNVKNGIAGGFSMGSSSSEGSQSTGNFGRFAADYLDVNALLGMYFGSANGSAGTAMVPVQKNVTSEGGTFGGPTFKCTLGKETIAEFDMKPLKTPLGQVISAVQGMTDAQGKMSPDGIKIVVPFLIDLFESLKSSPISVAGVGCSGTSTDTNAPFDFSMAGLNIDGFAPGIIPALSYDGIKVNGGGIAFSLGNATIKSIDLSGPFAALTAAGDDLSDAWFDANARKLIPAWGGFSLSGLDVTGPDPTSPGNQANVKVGSFDLSLDHYVNGVPTTVSTNASAIDVPLPNDAGDEAAQLLRQAGITTAHLGFDFSASWDKPTKTIAIEKLSLTETDLIDASISMVLGNAQDALFDSDNDTASAAAQALTLNSLHVTLTDRGAGDAIVPLLAAQQNTDAKTYRAAIAGQLEGALLASMGATDDTSKLATAVGAFVNGTAKTLDIVVASKDSAGVPLQAFEQAQSDPSTLFGLVSITGTAQ